VGWEVACYHDIPEADAANLLTAEAYVNTVAPTFTFHASYLDWPAGLDKSRPDTAYETMGDFLDGYISDLSDPQALDLPFDHFLLRATGVIDIRMSDTTDPGRVPPVWMDFGFTAFDGARLRLDTTTIFRLVIPQPPLSFFTEDAIVEAPGAYPIEVTFFQRFDPLGLHNADQAGFEFVACYPDGIELQSGQFVPCLGDAEATATPPRIIYQDDQIGTILPGDFDVDNDFDMQDMARLQACFTGPNGQIDLLHVCDEFDLTGDNLVDVDDWNMINGNFTSPNVCLFEPLPEE